MDPGNRRGRWISYGPGLGGKDHLTPEDRAVVERSEQRRGRLLCEVRVQVYEHDVVPWVAFPADSTMDADDSGEVAAAVERARESLTSWR